MSSVRVSIRIPSEIRDAIEGEGRTISEVVREALESHVQSKRKQENCYDMIQRLGIAGSVKNAPGDLSTNKGQFRDFGK